VKETRNKSFHGTKWFHVYEVRKLAIKAIVAEVRIVVTFKRAFTRRRHKVACNCNTLKAGAGML
jgi:hypothetical protein